MTGEVHGEEEKGQFLHHRDAALMGQCEGQRLHLWGLFGGRGLCVQGGAGPLSCTPQTDQVLKVLPERERDGEANVRQGKSMNTHGFIDPY